MYAYEKLPPADRHAPGWEERLTRERTLDVARSMVAPSTKSVVELAVMESERFK